MIPRLGVLAAHRAGDPIAELRVLGCKSDAHPHSGSYHTQVRRGGRFQIPRTRPRDADFRA
jgi:hypothetical protein